MIFVLPFAVSVDAGPRDFAIDSSGDISLLDPTRQARIYSAVSRMRQPDAEQQAANGEYPSRVSEEYLQLPNNLDPRIVRLAEEVTKNAASPYDKSAALEQYLQNTFGYTLDMVAPPVNADPLAYFLFTRKKGHCEYFSSAMAIMLRTQGIPSRVVNGFRNGEYNDVSGRYIVRAKDAHSWVEAYIPGFGWASFDPTPAVAVDEKTEWSRMMLYVDAMRDFWNDWVVNYDFSHQESLSSASISRSRHIFESLQAWFKAQYRSALDRARNMQRGISGSPRETGWRAILILAGILLISNLRKFLGFIKKALLARKPASAPRAAATIWYERMTRTLGRRGIVRSRAQTPQEFTRGIAKEGLRQSVSLFTEHYERARFGGSEQDAEKLPELFEEVEDAIK